MTTASAAAASSAVLEAREGERMFLSGSEQHTTVSRRLCSAAVLYGTSRSTSMAELASPAEKPGLLNGPPESKTN
jgi:hypothetical protein